MPSGSCLCGGVRYRVDGEIGWASHCHCSMCRKGHGAAFASYGTVPRAALRFEAGEDLVRGYESSPGTTRRFCGRCGSSLTFEEAKRPHEVELALGTLDEGDARVRAHIFVGSKAPWFEIADDLRRFDEEPEGG